MLWMENFVPALSRCLTLSLSRSQQQSSSMTSIESSIQEDNQTKKEKSIDRTLMIYEKRMLKILMRIIKKIFVKENHSMMLESPHFIKNLLSTSLSSSSSSSSASSSSLTPEAEKEVVNTSATSIQIDSLSLSTNEKSKNHQYSLYDDVVKGYLMDHKEDFGASILAFSYDEKTTLNNKLIVNTENNDHYNRMMEGEKEKVADNSGQTKMSPRSASDRFPPISSMDIRFFIPFSMKQLILVPLSLLGTLGYFQYRLRKISPESFSKVINNQVFGDYYNEHGVPVVRQTAIESLFAAHIFCSKKRYMTAVGCVCGLYFLKEWLLFVLDNEFIPAVVNSRLKFEASYPFVPDENLIFSFLKRMIPDGCRFSLFANIYIARNLQLIVDATIWLALFFCYHYMKFLLGPYLLYRGAAAIREDAFLPTPPSSSHR